MRGRKPKPAALHAVHGNPSKTKPPRHEPAATGDLADPPDWMDEDQQAGWRYAIEHAPVAMLKRIDRGALAAFIVAESLHRKATIMQNKAGLVVKMKESGAIVQSPYLAIINRQALIMLKAASELGFSPVSRPRIGRELPDAPTMTPANRQSGAHLPLDAYLDQHPAATALH